MRKGFAIIIIFLLAFTVHAQKPAWTVKLPKATNNTYMYVCEYAIASSETEARNQAIARVFQSTALRIGQPIESDKIFEAVQNGGDLAVISRQYNIPIYKVCEYVEKVQVYSYRVYVLCQVAVSGNITPLFDYNFRGCSDSKQYNNGVALAESIFIPGLGQMCKRHYTEGALTLTGEVLLVSAGFGCYFVSREELNIMKTPNITYEQFSHAYKTYNTLRTTSYVIWGAAAALYIFNLCRAYTLQPKYKETLAVYPALIPNNHNTAVGMGLTLNFK